MTAVAYALLTVCILLGFLVAVLMGMLLKAVGELEELHRESVHRTEKLRAFSCELARMEPRL